MGETSVRPLTKNIFPYRERGSKYFTRRVRHYDQTPSNYGVGVRLTIPPLHDILVKPLFRNVYRAGTRHNNTHRSPFILNYPGGKGKRKTHECQNSLKTCRENESPKLSRRSR